MRRFVVSELSMAPALRPGDRFLTRRLRKAKRGDIVFFPHPWRRDFWLVKRVAGLEGDRVEIEDGRVTVNGSPDRWSTDPTDGEGAWEIPLGRVFVLSDARHRSRADSRTFGPVATDSMYVALLRYRRGGQ